MEEKNRRRKAIVIGSITGAVVALATAAVAAVLTLSSTAALSGIITPTPCDTAYDVNPGTPTWNDAAGDYLISSVTYSNVDPSCSGESMKVNVLDSSGNSISFAGGIIGGAGTGSFVLTTPVPVANWESVASVIYTA